VRACVHRSECSYVYKYLCFYCVSKAMGSLLGEDRALVSPMLPSPPPHATSWRSFDCPAIACLREGETGAHHTFQRTFLLIFLSVIITYIGHSHTLIGTSIGNMRTLFLNCLQCCLFKEKKKRIFSAHCLLQNFVIIHDLKKFS
jgi:hypothetical protein